MHVIHARNVNDAFAKGVALVRSHAMVEETRAGRAHVMPTPVTTVYARPQERVLFHAERNANPFFHLVESVWMLAGSDNGRYLDTYVKDFSARYAETDGRIHGAYGRRWRSNFGFDQLVEAGKILYDNPTSRQVVVSMWDAGNDLGVNSKDRPCNLSIAFRGRHDPSINNYVLDMTVFNRSNDAVWGAWGANAVHMSVLQEVLAAMSGMTIGTYYQVSNNLHIYDDQMKRFAPESDPYVIGTVRPMAIIPDTSKAARSSIAHRVLTDCEKIMAGRPEEVETDWVRCTVLPVMNTHALFRQGSLDQAIISTAYIEAPDWRLACRQWLGRKQK